MSTQPITRQPSQLGGTLGTGRSWRRRLLLHHLPLALLTGLTLALFMLLPPFADSPRGADIMSGPLPQPFGEGQTGQMNHGPGQNPGMEMGMGPGALDLTRQLTTGTGYVATGLLALTLLIGPANLLLRRRNPVSSPLARDTGIWAAAYSCVHVILGFQVHGNASDVRNFLVYFFTGDGLPRTNSFGLGNWTGLLALVIVAGLLALSNDRSLRELKARRWKNLQRTNYVLFAMVVLHAFFYGALLRTTSAYTLALIVTVVVVFAGQAVGIALYRRRHAAIRQPSPVSRP